MEPAHTRDFAERDRGVLHLLGTRLDIILRRLTEKQRMEKIYEALVPPVFATSQSTTMPVL